MKQDWVKMEDMLPHVLGIFDASNTKTEPSLQLRVLDHEDKS